MTKLTCGAAVAFALFGAGSACKKSQSQRVDPSPEAPIPKGEAMGVVAPGPGASAVPRVPPAKQIAWPARTTRERNNQEEVLYGTWVATAGEHATKSLHMADRVAFSLDGTSKPFVDKVMTALETDNKLSTSCIWLELRPDFTGFRRECAVVNGQPSALDQNDITTGKKSDFGTKLEWYFDMADSTTKVRFEADMVVPAVRDGKVQQLVFRHWNLKLSKQEGEKISVIESFPEHDYVLPTRYAYTIRSQGFLD